MLLNPLAEEGGQTLNLATYVRFVLSGLPFDRDMKTVIGNRYIALAFRVLSSDFKFAAIIVDGGAVDALISLTRSADKACRLRYGSRLR